MEATECGAAALGSVLAYHGRFVALEELRVACGVSRNGSRARDILQAARRYGLRARGFTADPEALKQLPLPFVVHWRFNHFLVVEGLGRRAVRVNDPAAGRHALSWEEFEQDFTGVAITFEPTPEFQPGGHRRGFLSLLGRRLAGSHMGLAYVLAVSLALVVPSILLPIFARVFIDGYLVGGQTGWLIPLLVAMGVAAAFQAALTFIQREQLLRLQTRIAVVESSRLVRHLLRLPIAFYTQRHTGDLVTRAAINDRVARLLSGDLVTTLLSSITIGFYAIVMATYDLTLTAIGVAAALLSFGALRALAHRRLDVSRKLLQERAKLMGTSLAGLRMIETLKATGSENGFFARWAGEQAVVLNAERRLVASTVVLAAIPTFLASASTAAVLAIGGLRVIEGYLTIGFVIAFQLLLGAFLAPVGQLVTLGGQLQEAEAGMNRIDDVLNHPAIELPPAGHVEHRSRLRGEVEVRGLSFGYAPLEPPLVQDVTLRIRPGQHVALVGETGSGKSTIARLIAGLHEPWDGEVLFDGQPRSRIARETMTASLALVDQEISLFAGTIRDNLTLWDPHMPEEDLIRAAMDASIHDEILARPGGYDSVLDEDGRDLSGGQRQRLEIARALSRNPSILILDEATSALDPLTERAVSQNLRRRGCACLIVAHRLSAVRDCSMILVLDAGRVVERGTHAELSSADGRYAQLARVPG
jgi:NHLM bacteriocin system ABC transporter peptidase/ATP-binding protein